MTNRQTVASRLACSLLLAMAVGTQATAADTLETVEKDIAAKFEAVKSITADFVFLQRVKTEQFSAEATRKGNYAYMKGVDGKRRFRMEMKNTSKQTMQGNEMEVKSEVVIIDDGTHVVSLTTQENTQPSATKTLSDPKAISGGGGAAIEQLKRAYNVTLLPPTKIDGMDCYALEGKPKNPTPGLPVSNKS
ncbi:MAG: LolA family protein, partial [Phycisphaerae bacterium]